MSVTTLTPDELLSTTRSVRKRLDLDRPVEREVLEECFALALQAPSAKNRQGWRFVVVTDPNTRLALADIWRRGAEIYAGHDKTANDLLDESGNPNAKGRLAASVQYLADHLHE